MFVSKNKQAVKDVIQRARKLLKSRWITGWEAEDREGNGIEPLSDKAYRYCLVGALRRASRDLGHPPNLVKTARNVIENQLEEDGYHGTECEDFNDSQDDVQPVLDLLTRANKRVDKIVKERN